MKLFFTSVAMLSTFAAAGMAQTASTPPSAPAPAAQTAAAPPAAVPLPAGPLKIATLNFQLAVQATNEAQRDFGELEKKFAPRQAQLKGLNDEIATLQKQLQASGEKLSEEERASRVKSIEEKQKTLQRQGEDYQNDAQSEAGQVFQRVAAKFYDFVSGYANQNGFAVVLDTNPQSTSIVSFNPGLDITRAVVTGYNTKSGIPAPPPSAAGSQAPATSTPRRTAPSTGTTTPKK